MRECSRKTSDNARHCDVLGVARHTGQQAADAAHDHLDCDACAGCLSQLGDYIDIGQRIELEQDVAVLAFGNLLVHQRQNVVFQAGRRDEQAAVVSGQVAERHVVERTRLRPDRCVHPP